jgi:transcription elongation GreA/GreB family factor
MGMHNEARLNLERHMAQSTNASKQVALPPAIPRVKIGTRVEIELLSESGDIERLAFDVVSDAQADFAAGFLGAGTPLAQAILGQPAGATVPYAVADEVEVRVLSVASSERAPAPEVAAAREAAAQEAVSKANMEEMVRLALTVDVKWGDYDPEALESGWDKQP